MEEALSRYGFGAMKELEVKGTREAGMKVGVLGGARRNRCVVVRPVYVALCEKKRMIVKWEARNVHPILLICLDKR